MNDDINPQHPLLNGSPNAAELALATPHSLLLVITQCPTVEVADAISVALLSQQLAACVSRLPSVLSSYVWQGEFCQSEEYPLHIKTTAQHFSAITQTICQLHPYQVPEIIALPIVAAHFPYQQWILQSCSN
jgi:periplasmic divalent cation tolerance protein